MSQRGQKRTRRNSGNSSDSDLDDLSSHFSDLASPTRPTFSYAPVSIPEEDGGERRTENKIKTVKKKVTKKVTKYFIDPRTSNVTEVEVTEDEERKVYSQESKKAEEHRPSQKKQRIEYPMLGAPTASNNNSPTSSNYLTYPSQHQSQPRPNIRRPSHSRPRAILPAHSPEPNQHQRPLVFLSPSERGYTTPRNTVVQNERDIPSRPRPAPVSLNYSDQQQTPREPHSSSSFQRPTTSSRCPVVLRSPITSFAHLASSVQPPPQPPQVSLPPSPFVSPFGTFWKKPDNAPDTSTDEDSYSDSADERDEEKEREAKKSIGTTDTTTTTNTAAADTKE